VMESRRDPGGDRIVHMPQGVHREEWSPAAAPVSASVVAESLRVADIEKCQDPFVLLSTSLTLADAEGPR
jgi:hypothetical protein